MSFLSYRLKYDFYGLKPFVITVVIVELLAVFFLSQANHMDDLYNSLYVFFDIIMPMIFSILVLLVFGRDITQQNLEFLFSLPIKIYKLILIRYIRVLCLFLFICCPIMIVFYMNLLKLDSGAQICFWDIMVLLAKILPNVFALGGLSLLLLVLSKNTFVPLVMIIGWIIFDFCTFGKLLGLVSITANYYTELPSQMYIANRVAFAAAGVISPLLSWVIMQLYFKGRAAAFSRHSPRAFSKMRNNPPCP
ncbi:ABC transporter permease [Candidatus Soleaferrea massiliensis]|uniref:ABC transporter permease n=1 Tax=Candidatus Soleaferrea massiliensis TaxID=1470354 RepID=UPI00058FE53F|nr:ABC transporter permease [Candidatus Soleaferrea massiliensis]